MSNINTRLFVGVLAALLIVAAIVGGVAYYTSRPPAVTAGIVVDKWYTPARDWTYMQPTYRQQCEEETINGTQQETCTQVISGYIPIPEHDDAYWSLKLRAKNGRTGNVRVSHDVYRALRLGQFYDSKEQG